MSLLSIDENKCCQDALCASDCPRQIISMEGEGGFPQIEAEKEALCMACGHCVAICPHGALQIEGVPLEACPEINRDLALSWEQTEQFIRTRRSVRVYKDKPVERPTLQKLIELARYAPTASNLQTVCWTVLTDKDLLHKLSSMTIDLMRGVVGQNPDSEWAAYFRPIIGQWEGGYDGILRHAPGLVVASSPRDELNGVVDCTIALTTLELAAPTLGLGTCWAGLLNFAMQNSPEVFNAAGLPEGHARYYPMMIGYSKVKYKRMPERNAPVINWR